MIYRSKAPLRISLAGGGTDVSPYSDLYGGEILNATISLFARVTIEQLAADHLMLLYFTATTREGGVIINEQEKIVKEHNEKSIEAMPHLKFFGSEVKNYTFMKEGLSTCTV